MGATPRWMMACLLLPEGTSPEAVEGIFDQILDACSELGVALVGGHTEVTYDLPRPIAVGTMLGEVAKERVVLTSGARPGDALVVTKHIALEGTSLLAREASEALLAAGIGPDAIESARDLLYSPGISVAPEAALICDTVEVHAMHDPTEGGLATGLREMANAAGVGLALESERIPVLPECREFCRALGLDPLGLIASGSLLAAVAPRDVPRLVDALRRQGIAAQEIGRCTAPEEGLTLRTADGVRELPTFDRDELARWLGA
jgi:hydrogenase maturation factor